VIERKGPVPIIDDKNIPIKDMHMKFNKEGDFIRGGGLIKKGFDTRVTIQKKDV
jgi:hypothetical protein